MYFVTSNANKFAEAKQLIPELKQCNLDLEEIQSTDEVEIAQHKLTQAKKHLTEPFFVEDVSFKADNWNGLPGPFIKFFIKQLGAHQLAQQLLGSQAQAICTIGYFDGADDHIIQGSVTGTIVNPHGESFGFNPILEIDGQTLAQRVNNGDFSKHHRTQALKKLLLMIQ